MVIVSEVYYVEDRNEIEDLADALLGGEFEMESNLDAGTVTFDLFDGDMEDEFADLLERYGFLVEVGYA